MGPCPPIYLFSVIAYLQFPQDFIDEDGNPACLNLTQCFLFTLMHGLRQGGGIGDLLQRTRLDDPRTGARRVLSPAWPLPFETLPAHGECTD